MSNRNKLILLTITISLMFGSVTHAQIIKPEEKQAFMNFWNSLNKPLFEVEEKEVQRIEVPKIEIKLNSEIIDDLASLVRRVKHIRMPNIELSDIEFARKDRVDTFIGLEDKIKNIGFASLLNNIKEEYLGFESIKPRDTERNIVEIAHISDQFKKVRNFLSFTYNKVVSIELPDIERPEAQRSNDFLGLEKATEFDWASLWKNIDGNLTNIEVEKPERIELKPVKIGRVDLSIFSKVADHIYLGLDSIRNLKSDKNSAEAKFLEPFIDHDQRTLGNLLGILKDKIILFE